MLLTLVVAVADNRVIGRDNGLPWHLPADLAFFKRTTLGHPVVMGRRTWESIGRPLPGRHNIVISSRRDLQAPGCSVVHSLDEALEAAGAAEEVMLIGGGTLYAEALPRADRIHLTEVHAEPEGDTRFPTLAADEWVETARVEHPADAKNAHAMSFTVLERRRR